MRKVFSFDVFDTCLCRLCGEPRLLFDVLSLKVQKAMGEVCNEHLRQLFVAARVESGGKSLVEIYRQVAQQFPLPFPVERMAEMELETEKEMLVPIVATRRLVEQKRKQGAIVFISDMYLPSAFIQERLIEHGFFKEGDQLFVSDELGAWKHDGSLYRLVQEKEGLSYRHWYHYGDNRHSDYRIPRQLGIHAHHLHYDYSYYEEKWRHLPVLQFQFGRIAAGVCRAVRLQSEADESQSLFVADLSATMMLAWVSCIMKDANEKGIQRLYFCARDTLSEYHIARKLTAFFPLIEVRYLFVSSISLHKSNLTFEYLRAEGLADDVPAAIVDTCTSGRTLDYVNNLLSDNGFRTMSGYFLLRFRESKYCNLNACYELVDTYHGAMADKGVIRVMGMRIFFELVFSLNYHKQTVDYEYHGEKIRPLFAEDLEDRWSVSRIGTRKAKSDNDRLIAAMTDAYASTGLFHYAGEVFKGIAFPTLSDFVDMPRKPYLEYLRDFVWKGRPFVGKPWGAGRGVWLRGSRAYTFPSWMVKCCYSVMRNPNLRKRINALLG